MNERITTDAPPPRRTVESVIDDLAESYITAERKRQSYKARKRKYQRLFFVGFLIGNLWMALCLMILAPLLGLVF